VTQRDLYITHRDFYVTKRDVYIYDTWTLYVCGSGPGHGAIL